jgi:hypothetical protein
MLMWIMNLDFAASESGVPVAPATNRILRGDGALREQTRDICRTDTDP